MSLSPGTKLAHYEILEPIGKGGMGEVYRARDGKLGRDVAIKVLPEEFAKDEERLRRFQREAKVLASLNHPNIASIYGLEQSESTHYLVLELVPGETLAERISRGPIPLEEALDIATQMAEALEEAHEQGIVHRDLKPANVKQTEDGKIKVLDFGLAKVFQEETPDADSSMSPTLTRDATRVGVILGTAAYMSPEQAKGKKVDKRTDIFAFGAVLYEMLTGKRAFVGGDVSDTLAAVLRAEPDLDQLPAVTPANVRRLLRRSLRKNPRERLADIRDARLEIDEEEVQSQSEVTGAGISRRPWGFAFFGLLLGAIVTFTFVPPGSAPAPLVTRYTLEPLSPLGDPGPPAWSPDGTLLVYPASVNGVTQLASWVRAENEHSPLRGTAGAAYPFFSPDGEWIAFFADGSLKKVPVTGGPSQTLCPAGDRYGGSWGSDDTIVFASRSAPGLMRVSADGGEPQAITSPSGELRHTWPQWLPGGDAVLFTVTQGGPVSDKEVAIVSLESGKTEILLEGTYARFAPSGHLIFGRDASLWAVSFDADGLRVTGTPTPVIEGVQVNAGGGLAFFDLASDGALVYWTGTTSESFLARIDRQGEITDFGELDHGPRFGELRSFRSPRFSPEGSRIAVVLEEDVWTLDTARGIFNRLTVSGGVRQPVWTPDGSRVTYIGQDNSIYSMRADASGDPEELVGVAEGGFFFLGTWAPDGETLTLFDAAPPSQMYALHKGGSIEAIRSSPTPFNERFPEISPDGRWLVYASDETGEFEIYLQPYPGPGERIRVSLDGGRQPSWARDGREIFFFSRAHELMGASFDRSTSSLSLGTPQVILDEIPFVLSDSPVRREYDPAPDGESFVMALSPAAEGTSELHVVLNWLSELNERVPAE